MMLKRLRKRFLEAPQFFKFFFIGGAAAASDLAILYVLTEFFHLHYLLSAVVGFVVVTSAAFFAHKEITFRCARKDRMRQYSLFFLVNLAGLGLYSALLWIGVERLGLYYMAVAVVAKFLVFVWNFLANKFLTFKPHAV
jgi:putative flippase GtrA